jgi:hypothetical protein
MVAVPAAVPGAMTVAMMPAASAAHGDAAWLAELRRLRVHARCDLGHVRNEIRAQPHRIGRAGLAGRIAALCARAIEATNHYTREQDQRADETSDPHMHFYPSLEN